MKAYHYYSIALALFIGNASSSAQDTHASSSLYLQPQKKADVTLIYDINGEGKRFDPTWGLDQAWINEGFMRKGIRHMGLENVGIGRSTFRMTLPLTAEGNLQGELISKLRERSRILALASPTLPIVITADQGGTLNDIPVEEGGITTDESYVKNKSCNVDNWSALINAHVEWLKKNTKLNVVGVSPFNEPDYWTVEEGATPAKQRDVAMTLRNDYPNFANSDIAIVGGNTLNNDKALDWYNPGKQYYEWGNTHQLAGSFDTFAGFFQQLQADGKVGYADEMHNVGEAMIGLEYGMTVGIWWGFDSRARGEFCDISRHGVRLAYDEHRNNWTAASVYRHDDGRVKAFIGSSERQAKTTGYQFLSRDREVYYDGQGPMREFFMSIPGGTGYQTGQANAERVIDITWGDDVPAFAITEGTFIFVNKATGNLLAANNGNIVQHQKAKATPATSQWNVKPVSERIGGDFSFFDISSVSNDKLRLNVKNFSTLDGTDVIAYDKNSSPDSNEQWYLQYAGDGYYFIRSRETALYLSSASSYTVNGVNVCTKELQTDDKVAHQLWRLLPVDVTYETTPPAQPTGLTAEAQPASVRLSWTANSEGDLAGYMVLRALQGTDEWNTIARQLTTTTFVDNTCQPSRAYIYKVKAIDKALNQSAASEAVEAAPTGKHAMTAHWLMDGSLFDATANQMDAAFYGTDAYVDGHPTEGADASEANKAVSLNTSRFVQLPYEVASSDELTVAMWVYWRTSNNWQRLFDFGNGTDQYLFLTPSNGNIMRFAIKNGGDEQTVDCPTKLTLSKWKHVAVTIGKDATTIYVDGQPVATSTGITIRPSDIRPSLNYLGRSQFAADPLLTAYLDDVRIYNYALSAEEVQDAMTGATDAIDGTSVDSDHDPAAIYSLDGRRQTTPQRGINIIDGRKIANP